MSLPRWQYLCPTLLSFSRTTSPASCKLNNHEYNLGLFYISKDPGAVSNKVSSTSLYRVQHILC